MSELEKLKAKIDELTSRLKLAELFVEEMMRTNNVLLVQLDKEGNVLLVNDAVEKITGYSKKEILGKNWFEILVPIEKYPHVWKLFEDFKKRNEVVEVFENPILTKDGKERHISWRNSVLKKDGEVLGVLSFGVDITENINILTQLVESQKSFEVLIQNLPGVVYRCKFDKDFTMEFISERCFELTSYTANEFIANKTSYGNLILEEDRQKVYEEIEESIKSNKPFQLNYRIKTKEGEIKWVWEQGIVLEERDGQIILEGYIIDITDKIKIEEDLAIQREFFRQLFENAPIGIVILDRNDKIIDINDAFEKLFYFKKDEVVGLSLNQLIVPPDRKSEGLKLSDKVLMDEVVITETQRMRKDGSLVDVLVIGYPIILKGERVGIFGLYKDITEQKIMYELLKQEKSKIEELNKLKSAFLLNISHEIRTPLNSILGFSDLLISELESISNTELMDFAKSIRRGGMRLLNLMDNIIEISLIESSKAELVLEDFNISMVLDPIINSFEASANEKNLFLKKNFVEDFMLKSDAKRLTLVFRNLIDNAIKFTEKGGVEIKTFILKRGDKNLGIIEVIDTGIGISEKFKAKLFQPFEQESSGLSREYEGIGLGLNLTKKLVELLDGKIEIESEVNRGTIVRVIFPLTY